MTRDVGPIPILPKLEQCEERNCGSERPMPEPKMVLMGIVKGEWGSRQPEAARELGDLFPATQAHQFELRERKHRQTDQARV